MGFPIEGDLSSQPEIQETWRERFTQFICWITCGHSYIPIDTIYIQNRRYYFRACKRCGNKDEGYA